MGFFEILRLVLGTFRTNKLRTFLTLLGVIIGVTTVITVVSIVEGMNKYVISTITEAGSNTFRIDRFGLITNFEQWEAALRRKDLTLDDMETVRANCPLCNEVGAMTVLRSFYEPVTVDVSAGREKIEDPEVYGSTSNITDIGKRTVVQGRYFTEWEQQHSAYSTVLGYEIAKGLFPNLDPIGKTIHLNNRRFQVIGVLKKYGTFLHESRDTVVEIPISTFHKIFGKNYPLFIMVRTEDVGQMEQAQDQARTALRARHHRRYQDDDGFEILTTDTLVDLWRTFTAGAFAAMIGISSIALIVGGIVIMNIMLVSVVERTSEIGLRKAMGARSRDIRRQFLLESVLLAASGGLIGVTLGAAAAKLLSIISPLPSSLEPAPVIAGLALASSVGLISGLWPAMKAAKLDPIVALRTE
ncbi:MAG TPA: ABC transporter permease [Acidobacteriota bacterium]|nr:ABC transporter permease [Acidobacteriota bacterium]